MSESIDRIKFLELAHKWGAKVGHNKPQRLVRSCDFHDALLIGKKHIVENMSKPGLYLGLLKRKNVEQGEEVVVQLNYGK